MTGVLFGTWIQKVNNKMQTQNRNILLLLDNAPGHMEDGLALSNITIKFLLPNTTSHLQPLDAGIIKSFKAQYRKLYVHWLLQYEEGKPNAQPNILDAVRNVATAWDSVTEKTIRNCWKKTGIIPNTNSSDRNNASYAVDANEQDEQLALRLVFKLFSPTTGQLRSCPS